MAIRLAVGTPKGTPMAHHLARRCPLPATARMGRFAISNFENRPDLAADRPARLMIRRVIFFICFPKNLPLDDIVINIWYCHLKYSADFPKRTYDGPFPL